MKEDAEKRNKIKPQRLRCSVQNYDWGITGEESKVARLFLKNSGLDIQQDEPYAEFWMGTHGSVPSFIVNNSKFRDSNSDSMSLKSWILENPSVLGNKFVKKWGTDLPFLFKVLSVSKALSIQAHPDKELARTLHKLQPTLYKDNNHKPEIALALTEFEALCGFVSLEELKNVLRTVPEITELVGNDEVDQVLRVNEQSGEKKVKAVVQSLITQLMTASESSISETVYKMKRRLSTEKKVRQLKDNEQLVLRLEKQYPADIGIMFAFFLNYMKLSPGEALYLGANEPHAYIFGECIECMATSDNVVRAGLTSKYRDVRSLCSMLTYKMGSLEILQGIPLNPYTKRYLPPFDEFEVDRCILPQGMSTKFPTVPGPSIFVVTAGEGIMQTDSFGETIAEGAVLFIPADTEITVTATQGLELYRAGVNSRFLSEN